MGHPLWPLFDLRVRTERLELRLPTDDELAALCTVAEAGIHPPDEMPFAIAWTDTPTDQFRRQFVQYHWRSRATWQADDWTLDLAVFRDGEPIGAQGISAKGFRARRVSKPARGWGSPSRVGASAGRPASRSSPWPSTDWALRSPRVVRSATTRPRPPYRVPSATRRTGS